MMSATSSDWWPAGLHDWHETQAALHLRLQIVGKTMLALAPPQNHWWHIALHLTARGLTSTPLPCGHRCLQIDIDLLDHRVMIATSDGARRTLPLRQQPIAEFFAEYEALLHELRIQTTLWPMPTEIADPIPFADDHRALQYDRAAVERFFRMLMQAHTALQRFRSAFLGKCSPAHFWWGGFDLSCTRFSGRAAPQHPGGIPNLPDWVTREAYSHECISAGWWPGTPGGALEEPAFYAYAYPEPAGCSDVPVQPAAARYDDTLREWILPHRALLTAEQPEALVQEFLECTYNAAARLGSWSPQLVRSRAAASAARAKAHGAHTSSAPA